MSKAKDDLFASTGEDSAAPTHDDAVRERKHTATSGSKSGAKQGIVSVQQEQASTKGTHSGRKHPASKKMGGDENAGAKQGPTASIQE